MIWRPRRPRRRFGSALFVDVGHPTDPTERERAPGLRLMAYRRRPSQPAATAARVRRNPDEIQGSGAAGPDAATGLPECKGLSLTEPAFSLRQRWVQYVRFWRS